MVAESAQPLAVAAAQPVPARHRTVPIGIVFALVTAILVAVPVAVVAVLNIRANNANTFALLNNRAVLLIDSIETGIRGHLDDTAHAVDTMAEQHRTGAVDLSQLDTAASHLRGAITALPQVEALVVFRGDEQLVGILRGRDGSLALLPHGRETNADTRAALAAARTRADPVWGRLVFREGEVYANYAAPLSRGTMRTGLLVAAVSVTTLSRIVTEISDKFATTAFILEGPERVLAHPNLVSGHPELSVTSPTVPLTRIGDPVVAAFPDRVALEEFAEAVAAGVGVSSVRVANRDYVVIHRVVSGFGPYPWILGAYFPSDEVGSEVERLALAALVSFAAVIASLVLAFLIARLLSRPVRRFTGQAALITDLDLDRVANMPRSRIRELDQAAASFNSMLDGLRAFAAYVPKTLVTRLVRSGVKETTQSVERELTIMFTDIVGFTTMAEQLSASDAAHLLNHHFRILTRIIEAGGGTVDKFMGDGMMAFWGAPEEIDGHAAAACRAALAIAAAQCEDNARRMAEGGPLVRMRIGLHTGRVIVGNVGGGGRINYTVVGDAVNICQRLESLGHEVSADADISILVSAETAARAGPAFRTEPAGVQVLRGRAGTITALRLTGMAG